MLKNLVLGIRRIGIAVSLSLLLWSLFLLCRAEPEAKQSGLVLLLGNLVAAALFCQKRALHWLVQNGRVKGQWKQRPLQESLQVISRLTFLTALVALGAYILFVETCQQSPLHVK